MRSPARFVAQHGRAIIAACVGVGLIAIGAGIATRQAQGPEPSQPAADTAPDTATSIISGRRRCTLGPNAVPDCQLAAEALCRSKGYGSGTTVDFEMAQECPPPYCTMDYFVTRALCQ